MKTAIAIAIATALVSLNLTAHALPRDASQVRAFKKDNPCPSTGSSKGACPTHDVDHKQALQNGGADKPHNMQWLDKQAHKQKTKQDNAECMASYTCKNKRLAKKFPWERKQKAKRTKKQM